MRTSVTDRMKQLLHEPKASSITLEQMRFRCGVASDDVHGLSWVKWFLKPSFHATKEPPNWQIVFHRNDRLCRELLALVERGPYQEVYPCILRGTVLFVCQEIPVGPFRLLYEVEVRAFYAALPEEHKLLILSGKENLGSITGVMRAVREFSSLEHQRRSGIVLRAAAVEQDGWATLILARNPQQRMASLIRLLLNGAKLISSEWTILCPTPGGIRVVGVPSVAVLRLGDLNAFPNFQARLERQRHDYRVCVPDFKEPGVWRISPLQLSSLSGTVVIGGARLGKLFFVGDDTARTEQLDPLQGKTRLQGYIVNFTESKRFFFPGIYPVDDQSCKHTVEQMSLAASLQAECWQLSGEEIGNG